ncbi:calmodulin-beta-like [Hydractinia symbiolongicarpus]|uniref:calmodulin-beta-like n=1 Tax=Hydractinia symbiolongicarpus TaxID=13093 RepID=UPI00254D4BC0|nr:calmodulin-beta-like [Hydractinia symbiolongicarpus]
MNRFTPDQIREYNDAFCLLDSQNKGFILSTQLRDMLKTIGYNPTDKDLENLTILVDDGNGEIDFNEFMDLIDRLETEEKNQQEARIAFNAFDFMGEGFVAANDIKEALVHIMEKADEKDLQAVIKHFKLEQNRKISFPEFKDMMTLPANK